MDQMSSHYFYVLQCKDDTLYAGYTNDLNKRVATHNAGKGAKYTKARIPVKCIYFETFETKQEAMRAEYAFKQYTRKQKLDYIGRNLNEVTKK
jgi:putative endonuclease